MFFSIVDIIASFFEKASGQASGQRGSECTKHTIKAGIRSSSVFARSPLTKTSPERFSKWARECASTGSKEIHVVRRGASGNRIGSIFTKWRLSAGMVIGLSLPPLPWPEILSKKGRVRMIEASVFRSFPSSGGGRSLSANFT